MKTFLVASIACGLLAASASPAAATGGFSCSIDDDTLRFEAQSPLGRGMGSPIINLVAKGDLKLKGIAPDFTSLELSKHLVHSWMVYPDTRLHFYKERDADKPHGYVELVISAVSADDEGEAKGTYELTVFEAEGATSAEPVKATGKVTCFVE